MTAVLEAAGLRGLTDDELRDAYQDMPEDVIAEAKRRDYRAAAVRKAAVIRAQWHDAAFAQYLDAEAATRGNLVARGSNVTDGWQLWQGSPRFAAANASEELRNYWRDHPRVTVTGYARQVAAGRRIERQERERMITDDKLGRDDRGRVRPVASTDQESPQVRGRSTIDAVPAAAARGETRERASAGPVRDGRHVRRDGEVMTTTYAEPVTIGGGVPVTAAPARAAEGIVMARDPGTVAAGRRDQDAAALLRRVLEGIGLLLTDYVAFPSRAAVLAAVGWTAQAAARDADGELIWRAYVRLLVTSRMNGSGKSTLGDLISMLLKCRAGRMSKVTPYGLTKVLGSLKETAIADDAQNVFRSDKAGTELLTILINGYTRGATWVSGKNDGHVEPAAGPVMIIGKDELITKRAEYLKDLIDRSAVIRLERPDRYMPEVDEEAEGRAAILAEALKAVMGALLPQLRQAAKELAEENRGRLITDGDGGRTAQIWRPMLAVARVAGGPWPDAMAQAMEELSAAGGDLLRAGDALAGLEDSRTDGRSFWDAFPGGEG